MRFRLWVLFFTTILQTSAAENTQFRSIYDFTSGGRSYSIFVIAPVSPIVGVIDPGEQAQLSLFVDKVKTWITDQYITRYPNESEADLRKMVSQDNFIDGRSSMIVVTEQHNVEKIYASMRFVWTNDQHPQLPLESYLNVKLKQNALTYGEYPRSIELWKNDVRLGFIDTFEYEKKSVMSGRVKKKSIPKKSLSGATVEIKNFIVDKNAPQDLVPLLFYISEKEGISYSNFNSKLITLADQPDLKHLPASQLFQYSSSLNKDIPISDHVHASEYVLYAKPPMDVYYRSLHFKVYPGQPQGTGNTIFYMDRETYARSIGDKFYTRPGLQLLKEGRLKYLPRAHLFQGEILGIPSVFEICVKLTQKASPKRTTDRN